MGPRDTVTPPQEGTQAAHRAAALEASGSLTSERFPPRARLGRGPDLTGCWNSGHRRHTPHLELAWRPNSTGHPRVGIVVPRYQHTAVARNRLRRRLREILRRHSLASLPAIDLVLRARRSAYAAAFAVLRAELTDAAAKLV